MMNNAKVYFKSLLLAAIIVVFTAAFLADSIDGTFALMVAIGLSSIMPIRDFLYGSVMTMGLYNLDSSQKYLRVVAVVCFSIISLIAFISLFFL